VNTTPLARFGRHAFGVAAAAVVLSAGVAGCSSGSDSPKSPGSSQPAASQAAAKSNKPFGTKSVPTRLTIPRLKVNAPVQQVGLAPDGTVQTPALDDPDMTGWYKNGPTPGQLGPAVILGHIDTAKTGPAVFFKLRQLKPGDSVTVKRTDGSSATFAVQRQLDVSKKQFPTKKVYGDISYAGLRLITCGGKFDRAKGSYENNTIVFAKLTSTTAA
jgi:sortase (surface protein transpeptidase)